MVLRSKAKTNDERNPGSVGRLCVVVDNRLRLDARALPEGVEDSIRSRFTYENPERDRIKTLETAVNRMRGTRNPRLGRMLAMLHAMKKAPVAIATWRREGDELSVPRGGLGRLAEELALFGGFDIDDRRTEGEGPKGIPAHLVVPWDFQAEMVEAAASTACCLLRAPTASGKSTASLALAAQLDLPTLVVVDRGPLLKQWVKRASKELGIDIGEVGVIQGATKRVRPITIGMMQTLVKCAPDYARTFGLVIVDEVHKAAARTFVDVVDVFEAKHVVGVSDDERRKDDREFLVYDQFGDVALQVDEDDLVARRFVLDPEVRLVPTDFEAPWYVKLPQQERGFHQDRLLDEISRNETRSRIAVEVALEEVAKGEQVVVLADRVEHVQRMQAQAARRDPRVGLLLGGPEMAGEYARTVDGIESGAVQVAFGTYQAGGTGIDFPRVTRGVLAAAAHTNRTKFRQARGRFCRASGGKTDAVLYVLWDVKVHGLAPLRRMLDWNRRVLVRTEHEGDGRLLYGWRDGREYLKEMRDAEDRNEGDDGRDLFGERNPGSVG